MAQIDYVLYDSVEFGTTAGVWTDLFQVSQGADATHNESFTNSRGAGSLPQNESFELQKIGVMPDYEMVEADAQAIWLDSILEIRVADRTIFKVPLAVCAQKAAYSGVMTQATAADQAIIGLKGDGFTFKNPIQIPGGEQYKIRIYQGTALAAADSTIKVMLTGILTL